MSQIKQRLAAVAIAAGAVVMLGSEVATKSFAQRDSTSTHAMSAAQAASQGPRRGVSSEVERYANRERVTPALGNFRGGDTIALGASSIALILALVLVLVLI